MLKDTRPQTRYNLLKKRAIIRRWTKKFSEAGQIWPISEDGGECIELHLFFYLSKLLTKG